jgi:hypothetical protein
MMSTRQVQHAFIKVLEDVGTAGVRQSRGLSLLLFVGDHVSGQLREWWHMTACNTPLNVTHTCWKHHGTKQAGKLVPAAAVLNIGVVPGASCVKKGL